MDELTRVRVSQAREDSSDNYNSDTNEGMTGHHNARAVCVQMQTRDTHAAGHRHLHACNNA